MKQRSPIAVFFLICLTFGIYQLVWYIKTSREMRSRGADVPTTWLLLIPLANLYWLCKWCQGIGTVTNGSLSGLAAFLLLGFLGPIGAAIIQSKFNRCAVPPLANAPVASMQH